MTMRFTKKDATDLNAYIIEHYPDTHSAMADQFLDFAKKHGSDLTDRAFCAWMDANFSEFSLMVFRQWEADGRPKRRRHPNGGNPTDTPNVASANTAPHPHAHD